MPLSEPQKQVISSDKRFRVLITGRRFGKTYLCLLEILRQARNCDNGRIYYVSPSYRMSKEIMWKQLKKMVKKLRWEKYINESDLTVVLVNNCQISLKGADKTHLLVSATRRDLSYATSLSLISLLDASSTYF